MKINNYSTTLKNIQFVITELGDIMIAVERYSNGENGSIGTAMKRQTKVNASFLSEQLLLFVFVFQRVLGI